MAPKKVFILFPDGVGLRNFAFTQFKDIGDSMGFNSVYWNNTVFSIKETLGYPELKIENTKIHPKTAILNRARKRVELKISEKRFNDSVYSTYTFPLSYKGGKSILKSLIVKFYEGFYSTPKGWGKLKNKIYKAERSTERYNYCKAQLSAHRPDIVFCTTQRATQAIAPILAAQDLGIPTACWIYSWDNLPKGMSTIECDYYFVWSQLMKEQLMQYYPKTKEHQIFVTGTPQFEPHFNQNLLLDRKDFLEKYGLDVDRKYICFSGDDKTTSPLDQYYLQDTAEAVKKLREEGYNLGIIYRKVPIDFSDRYDFVLEKYKDIISSLDPIWKPMGERWNEVMPTREDFNLLVNTCRHSELVVNICSSMVFDFVAHNKPCIYPNYEQPQLKQGIRDIGQNYNYVHFRSMPKDAVVWASSKEDIYSGIKLILDNKIDPVPVAKKWFGIVNRGDKPNEASKRIWEGMESILQ
ncbi:UDP-glycosyltransferase [Algibacter sp. 2305UL17-15]|uniref:UDP-glycosyltransferase n=1 Tax=Algibacter sp. 2305UL17-15 TaxID=3231268 RepID=UPI00345817A6